MNYYWMRDKIKEKQLHIYWEKSANMKADYHTKHHPILHHRAVRSTYVSDRLNDLAHSTQEMLAMCITLSQSTSTCPSLSR